MSRDTRDGSAAGGNELKDRSDSIEGALRYVSGLQRTLMEISRQFIAGDHDRFNALVDDALARVGDYCGVDRSYMFRFSHGFEIHTITHEWCADGIEPARDRLQAVRRSDVPNIVARVERREAIRIPSLARLGPEWAAEKCYLADQDIRSMLVVPVVTGDDLYGHIGFDSVRREREWNEEEANLLEVLADIIANTIRRDLAEEAHRESEARFHAIAEHLPGDFYQRVMDPDGRIHVPYVSPSIRRVFGVDPERVIADTDYLLSRLHPDDHQGYIDAVKRSASTMQTHDIHFRILGPEGDYRWVRSMARPQREVDGSVVWYGIAIDETEHKNAEARVREKQEEITYLAMYDPLTGLPNRRLLMDRLRRAIIARSRDHRSNAFLFLDIDNFKNLNDTLGHDVGDQFLVQVAARLTSCLRQSDTVARFGGDEFAIILADLDPDPERATEQAHGISAKILECLTRPYDLNDHERHSTVSIGITLLTDPDDTVEDLLKRADLAMYDAKGQGRNAVQLFDPAMRQMMQSRVALESDLRTALEQGDITPHFQIQVGRDGAVTGAEALARWHHAEHGPIPPATFIAVAEESDLILTLGDAILSAVCDRLAQWAATEATAHLSIAVNVSARQFHHESFPCRVESILDRSGAPADRLRLELTESVLLSDINTTVATMQRLRSRGVLFALDDFGTGYSSLAYLKRLPLDQLKIDQQFVHDLLDDENNAAIVRTIVVLAQSMGLDVIAEGVEDEAVYKRLLRYGCHAHQGFHFGYPVTGDEFLDLYIGTDS